MDTLCDKEPAKEAGIRQFSGTSNGPSHQRTTSHKGHRLHGTTCILLVLFNLPPKDSLSIKDKVSAPKVYLILPDNHEPTCG